MKKILENRSYSNRLIHYFSFFILSLGFLSAQTKTVSGTITDANDGSTLPGVTVLVKGTQNGAITDIDGKFTLEVPSEAILKFTYIGYLSEEETVGQRSIIDIALNADIQELSEVVVIGYGSAKKKDLTGVVSKVDSKDFNKGAIVSPKQLISGKIAGVQVANDGSPRGGADVRIRGGSTFGGNSDPLYVIDGIPMTKSAGHNPGGQDPLSFINPSDVESVTVLKDASAAAIYGVQGASGVIIITTKSGTSGKLNVSYDASFGVNILSKPPQMLSTEEFIFTVERKGPKHLDDIGLTADGEQVLFDTDWANEVTRLSTVSQHNVSATFGGEKSSFRTSFGYTDFHGVLLTDRSQRITPSIKYDQKLFNDNLNITLTYNGAFNKDRLAPNVMNEALAYAPTQPVFNDDPVNGGYFEWEHPLAPRNPMSAIEQTFNQNQAWRHFTGALINYNVPFIEGLSVKGNFGYDKLTSRVHNISLPTLRPNNSTEPGSYFFEKADVTTKIYELFANYKKTFGKHSIDLSTGHSFQDFRGEYPNMSKANGVLYEEFNINDPLEIREDSYFENNSALFFRDSTNISKYRLASVWGRLNYSLNDKYLMTVTLRNDGSSRFSPENDFALFPSFAFAWRAIDEPFMEPLNDMFSELKFRLGYGVTGNQDIQREFGYVDLYERGNERARYILGSDTVSTLRPSGANPLIQWEETASTNIGIDFGILDGRINGSLDFYSKKTTDLLRSVTWPIGSITSFTEFENIAAFEVKGIELNLNAHIYDSKNLKWKLGFNASTFKDKITGIDFSNDPSFIGYQVEGIDGDVGQTIQILRLGERLNTFFVYEHNINASGNPVSDTEDFNGDGSENLLDMYVDQNSDSLINENDLIPFKSANPKLIVGLTSNLSYKQFDLALTIRGQFGNYVYNNIQSQFGAYQGVNDPSVPRNVHISAYENDFTTKQLFSSSYVENASFVKLDNITIGYRFNTQDGFTARAFATATNLLTITGYSGVDPEVGIRGIDRNPYPRSRTFILGFNITLN